MHILSPHFYIFTTTEFLLFVSLWKKMPKTKNMQKEMENGKVKKSGINNGGANGKEEEVETPTNITIKGILALLMATIDSSSSSSIDNKKRTISLGMGDPTAYSCFHTTAVAEEAVVDNLRSQKFNGYSPTVGLPQTRK